MPCGRRQSQIAIDKLDLNTNVVVKCSLASPTVLHQSMAPAVLHQHKTSPRAASTEDVAASKISSTREGSSAKIHTILLTSVAQYTHFKTTSWLRSTAEPSMKSHVRIRSADLSHFSQAVTACTATSWITRVPWPDSTLGDERLGNANFFSRTFPCLIHRVLWHADYQLPAQGRKGKRLGPTWSAHCTTTSSSGPSQLPGRRGCFQGPPNAVLATTCCIGMDKFPSNSGTGKRLCVSIGLC